MPGSAGGLPDISWITSVTRLLDRSRIVALLVICLAIGISLWRGRTKDFGFWLTWTIVGLCALTIIGSEVRKQFTNGEVGGGSVSLVPNNMFLYSDERNSFFIARLRNGTFLDRNDYQWIRLNNGSEDQFRHINFIIDQNKKKIIHETRDVNLPVVRDEIDPAPIRFNMEVPVDELGALRNRTLSLELHTPPATLPYILHGKIKIQGTILDPGDTLATGDKKGTREGSLFIPRAYAEQSDANLENALKSTRANERAQALRTLREQFELETAVDEQGFGRPKSIEYLRLAVVSTVRNRFKDDTGNRVPTPQAVSVPQSCLLYENDPGWPRHNHCAWYQ